MQATIRNSSPHAIDPSEASLARIHGGAGIIHWVVAARHACVRTARPRGGSHQRLHA